MPSFDTPYTPQSRASTGNVGNPPPKKRRKPMDTLEAVRKEMTSTYWEMKENTLDLDKGKARIYVLGKITEVLKAEKGPEDELQQLLEKLRGKIQ